MACRWGSGGWSCLNRKNILSKSRPLQEFGTRGPPEPGPLFVVFVEGGQKGFPPLSPLHFDLFTCFVRPTQRVALQDKQRWTEARLNHACGHFLQGAALLSFAPHRALPNPRPNPLPSTHFPPSNGGACREKSRSHRVWNHRSRGSLALVQV